MTAPEDGRRVVVGYDGSEAARAAVAYATDRAGSRGKVIVVHASGPATEMLDSGHGQAVLDALLLEDGNALLDRDFELELADGPAARELARIASERDADEIVVGSRGFGRVRSALGSVSRELLHEADRPVVVIPDRYARTHARVGS